jgi:hypothetical protein
MAVETLEIRALRLLAVRIDEEWDSRARNLATGAASSFDDYKQSVGYLRGLEKVKELCVEVEAELYGKRGDK